MNSDGDENNDGNVNNEDEKKKEGREGGKKVEIVVGKNG